MDRSLISKIIHPFRTEESERVSLVKRLLETQAITFEEAALLMKTTNNITINAGDVSSGARIIVGNGNLIED